MELLQFVAYILGASVYALVALLIIVGFSRSVWLWFKSKRTRPRWTVR